MFEDTCVQLMLGQPYYKANVRFISALGSIPQQRVFSSNDKQAESNRGWLHMITGATTLSSLGYHREHAHGPESNDKGGKTTETRSEIVLRKQMRAK
jgi:hypothetical protein